MDEIINTVIPEETPPEIVRNFATIGEVFEDGVSLIFDGETEPTEKHYLCNTSVHFSAGDRVRIVEDSGTYIVEYTVGSPRQDEEPHGIPAGGTSGQILGKSTEDDFDVTWLSPRFVPSSGNTGYLLTKTADSYAWAAAPVEIPSGGSTGQVLTKTSNGYDWANITFPSVNEVPATGTTGYVLTKTSGSYAWQAAPTELPSSGTTGYVLTKTASGVSWSAVPTELPSSGATGYVLTKTSSGVSWSAPPGGVPTGGTTGQVLTKTATGSAWQAVPTPTSLVNSYSSGTNYYIQIRSTSSYYTTSPVFQIRMAGSSTWKTITTT